ncbi:FAD-dependent oxidoreductase [Microbacterium sp.]|uniref:FAD-dependent oxidoreductase n=1 Tax=Microbacterium sp. TaxID=51671 RepID=UPI002B8FF010|nr:FAD-dependent oxidoreductase [Microbacterium sp.]HWL78005.1 FAD-dependent oxidoreductase [Microbacterium sp.]
MSEAFDVIVLGSGAAGLTAAFTAADHGASVAVFEKNDELGGTSAWSGGHIWVPNNPYGPQLGIEDSEDDAMTYMRSLGRGVLDEDLARTYIHVGPEMLSYLDDRAGTEFFITVGFPDYHAANPGGRPEGGRTVEVPLFSFDELGEWKDKVTTSPYLAPYLTMSETPLGATVPHPPSPEEIERRNAHNERGSGQALVGRLLRANLRAGTQLRLSHRATRLLTEDGRVIGVEFATPDGTARAYARRGVVLATGGFEWNEELKRAFLRGPLTHPVSIPSNEGDGLIMAMRVGAALQNMREAWWSPVAVLPEGINRMNRMMINADRTRPRSIMVNRMGRRFTNEAASYNAVGGAFHQEDVTAFDYANLPCWLVFDEEYFRRFGSIGRQLGAEEPRWLIRADTLDDLAEKLGVPADELNRTVARWNENVARGVDPDFHRGESAHDLWWGDPYAKGRIEGTLGPIDTAPYYALPLTIGALGTKGGPKVDTEARVIDLDGEPIPGLYAAGNVSSPTGMAYAGAGGTLGPAMTFGYIAGRGVARHEPAAVPTDVAAGAAEGAAG